jgi:hypothetical protein
MAETINQTIKVKMAEADCGFVVETEPPVDCETFTEPHQYVPDRGIEIRQGQSHAFVFPKNQFSMKPNWSHEAVRDKFRSHIAERSYELLGPYVELDMELPRIRPPYPKSLFEL